MKAELTATVINGLLKPDESLHLPDHTRVKLTIETIIDPLVSIAAWQELMARLQERPVHSGGKRYTRDELHERG